MNLQDREEMLDEILAEYFQAKANVAAPTPELLLERHPDFRRELNEFFRSQEDLDQFAAPVRLVLGHGRPGRIGETVGQYELQEELGRGGMGVVFRARHMVTGRPVALKMLRAGSLASDEELRRFRAEVQAVSSLEHPNIVPIYEIGEFQGAPYFCMKLIPERSLSDQIGRGEWRATDRVQQHTVARLLAQVARAVHFAHQHGFLHRDLKPANILVDAAGHPFVNDFGLVKPLANAAELTASGHLPGTPAYMAPEQARGRQPSTVAVDVYGLGAILYVSLTGKPPFTGATPHDVLAAVESQAPAPPRDVNPAIDLDLQTICLKCLSKEPHERYASAAALADDLEAYAQGRPIQARPLSVWKRSAYWCRRQPVLAGLGGALAASLLVGTALVVYHGYQAQRNFELAEGRLALVQAEKDRADEHFKLAHKAIVDFSRLIEEDKGAQANHPLQQKSLELARTYFEDFVRLRADDLALKNEFAETLVNLANINDRLGRRNDALEAVGQAQSLLETLGKSDADDPAWALQQSKVTNLKAGIIWRGGKAEEARRLFEKDLAAVEAQLQSNPEDVKLLIRRARLEANLGGHYVESLNRELALPHLKKAQDLFTRLVEKNDKSQDARAGLAGTLHNLAILSYRDNQAKAALADFHAATVLCGQLAKEFPTSGTHQRTYAFAKQHEAMCLRALGRKEEAAKLDVEALRIREGLARSNPAVVGVQIAWAASCRDVADDYRSEGRHTEALALYRQAVGVIEPLAKKDDATVVVRQMLIRLLDSMGRELHYMKHTPEALAAFTRAIDHGELLVAQLPNQFDCRSTLGIAYWDLAQVHANENALGAARTAMQKNIDHERKLIEQAPSLVYYRKSLSRSLVTLANWDRKEKKFADAVQHARERAQLWPGNGDELFHVAQDFCHTAVQAEAAKSPEADRAWAQCEATLRQALTAGLAWAKLDSVPIMQAFTRRPVYAELRKEFSSATQK